MVEEALVEADERDSGAGGGCGDADGGDDGRVGGGGSDGGAGEEEEAGTNEEDMARQASRMRRRQSMIGMLTSERRKLMARTRESTRQTATTWSILEGTPVDCPGSSTPESIILPSRSRCT